MSFLTTNPSPFVLNQPELTNVITNAAGGSSALCNAIADLLSVIDTANARFSANTLGAFSANSINVTNTLNLCNASITINGSNALSSNVLNGTTYMAIQALGLEKARFTVNGFGVNNINPRAELDIVGNTVMRGNLYMSTVSFSEPIGSIYFNGFETLTYNTLNGDSIMNLTINDSNVAFIKSNGVGIFTSNPVTSFDVSGATVIRGDVYVSTGGHLYVENGLEMTASTVNGYPYLAFETSGAEKVRITSNGTGFNTTTPEATLDVSGDSILRSNVYLSTSANLYIDNTNVLSASSINGFPHLAFEVNGIEKMRLVSNSLGIETSDPKATLDVNGPTIVRNNLYLSTSANLYINNTNVLSHSTLNGSPHLIFEIETAEVARFSTNGMFIQGSVHAPNPLYFAVQQSTLLSITPSSVTTPCALGIGTSTPTALLDIVGNSVFRSSIQIINGGIQLSSQTTLSHSTLHNVYDFEIGSNVLVHLTSNAVAFLNPLGVFTSTPQAAVDVNGDILCRGAMIVSTIHTPDVFEMQAKTSTVMYFTQSTVSFFKSGAERELDISGSILARGNMHLSTNGAIYSESSLLLSRTELGGADEFRIKTAGIDRLTISTTGIGVNTLNPETAFDVRGNTLVGGALYVSSMGASVTSSLGYIYADGDVFARNLFSFSDSNLKYNISKYTHKGLPTPVQFQWKNSGKYDIGVIAQEMAAIEPACVSSTPSGTQAVDYSKLVVLCLAELQELRAVVSELKQRILTMT